MSFPLLALAVLMVLVPDARAADVEREHMLERALDAYKEALDTPSGDLRRERFRSAERLFAGVARTGVENPDLYTNLGNAALQGERLGAAILAYRRALWLDPDHARAARTSRTLGPCFPSGCLVREPDRYSTRFFFWHRTQSRAERSMLAALLFFAAALLLAASILRRSAPLRNLAMLPALGWCAVVASLLLDPASSATREAVVTSPEVVARPPDSVHSPRRFSQPLPAGTELRVLEERDGWIRVGLANGREGWISSSSVGKVRSEPSSPGRAEPGGARAEDAKSLAGGALRAGAGRSRLELPDPR